MRSFFNTITDLSLRFKWITIILTIAVLVGGYVSFTELNQELLPAIEFPQTFVLVRNSGASSDQLLAMYSQPIEDGAEEVFGVINVETTSSNGFAIAIIRNDYGLDQPQVVQDIRDQLEAIPLPVRTVVPPDGQNAADLVGELSPEAVLWLYNWALVEDSGFIPQLTQEAILAFSPEAIGVLPEEAFTGLDNDLRTELQAKAVKPATELETIFDPYAVEPPALPESWQADRFETVLDITELTTIRNLAGVFNDFVDNNELIGPLGTTSDLTPEDLALFVASEEACLALDRPAGEDGLEVCSFFKELDATMVLALSDEVLAAFPDNYLDELSLIDRNEIAQARVAEALSGEKRTYPDVVLPDTWRVEAPQILTFSFSDFPLAAISINSESLTAAELEDFVIDVMAPRLRDVGLVARVSVDGGEIIPANLVEQARALENGTPLPQSIGTTSDTEEPEVSEEETNPLSEGEATALPPAADTGDAPALPPTWSALAGVVGADEMDSADDLVGLVGAEISGVEIESLAGLMNSIAEQPTGQFLLNSLTIDVLDYLAAQEDGFYENLSNDWLAYVQENNAELYAALPVTERAAPSPSLGDAWQQLSQMMPNLPLQTVEDLNTAGAVTTIETILTITTENGFDSYAVQLMDGLSPAAMEAILADNPDFLSELTTASPQALTYLSRSTLASEPVQAFINDLEDADLQSTLQGIVEGNATAAETLAASDTEREVFVDSNAPALPSSWAGVAGFVGASELDTADDVFNVTQYDGASGMVNSFAINPQGQDLVSDLQLEHWSYFGEQEPLFWERLSASSLRLMTLEDSEIAQLPQGIQNRIAAGGEAYSPDKTVTRTDLSPSLVVNIFKEDAANTVIAWDNVDEVLKEFEVENEAIAITVAFEQASFITDSLEGVQREGLLGAGLAIIMILVFMNLSFRSTIVTSISIPVSVMVAFLFIQFVPGNVYSILAPMIDNAGRDSTLGKFLIVVIRLFPETFTINIMTLSGLTVAIGRVVDDSIVVLENIYRNIQIGGKDKRESIMQGTREMSVAIFAATATTMLVFLPLGLFGGVTGAFFIPFGLANAYALAASFVVAITIVPVLADLLISRESMPEEGTIPITSSMTSFQSAWARFANIFIGGVEWLSHQYSIIIKWALDNLFNQFVVVVSAIVLLGFGLFLMGNRPVQFLPSFGEPTSTVAINLPAESIDGQPVDIALTDAKVRRLEAFIQGIEGVNTVQVVVGSAGQAGDFVQTGNITQTAAAMTITWENQDILDANLPAIRAQAEAIFNDMNNDGTPDVDTTLGETYVTVSGAAADGGFGGFSVVVKGTDADNPPTLTDLAAYNETVLNALNSVEGLVNVDLESNLGGGDNNIYVRIDGEPALRYTGEIEADDTIGTTTLAIQEVQDAIEVYQKDNPDLVDIEVTQGFDSEQQQQGIADIFISMAIATLIAYLLLTLTFGNPMLPIEILISLPLAIVGAAVALTVTGRVLGLPAMIGLLMLVGIVLTNAIVFLDRVQQNRRSGISRHDSLVEAGLTRLRPILMTAATTITAQLPLAASTEGGGIIAAELGTVVVGGLVSSTILTLLVLPVVYSLFDKAADATLKTVGLRKKETAPESSGASD